MRKPIVTALSVMLSAAITLSLTATASYAQDEVTADTAPNTVQTQAQPETEATIQPEANTQSETNTAEAQTQAPAQSETDAQTQTESETQPGPNAQTQPQATTTTQPEAQPETQPAPETQQDTATPLQTQSTDNTIRAAMNGYAHSASSDYHADRLLERSEAGQPHHIPCRGLRRVRQLSIPHGCPLIQQS